MTKKQDGDTPQPPQADQVIDSATAEAPKLQPYQQRVVEEAAELDKKLLALINFNGSQSKLELSKEEQFLLVRQEQVMSSYSRVLHQRIELFNK